MEAGGKEGGGAEASGTAPARLPGEVSRTCTRTRTRTQRCEEAARAPQCAGRKAVSAGLARTKAK